MGLTIEHVSYVYDPDAPLPQRALEDICLTIPEGQFIGIIATPVRESPPLCSI